MAELLFLGLMCILVNFSGASSAENNLHAYVSAEKGAEQPDPGVEVNSEYEVDVATESPVCDCPEAPPRDCYDVLQRNPDARTGIHVINIGDDQVLRTIPVFCDMETDGGGWTVFQRRINGGISFYRDYKTYAEGFGIVSNEFWLGNEKLHFMTSRRNYEMRVDLTDANDNTAYAKYSTFFVNSACDGFRLSIDGFTGNATDGMRPMNNNMRFTTFDRDQDTYSGNCAVTFHGAWWYGICTMANLNGHYQTPGTVATTTIHWRTWTGNYDREALQHTEMKIRPALLQCPL